MNVVYVIIHRTGKFGIAIREWNRMSTVQKMWVGFYQLFWTVHQELSNTTDLTVQDVGMHHAKMVRDVVAVLQEFMKQEQAPTDTTPFISEPN